MKKLFLFASLIVTATVTHASYLYWAVGTDGISGTDNLTAVTSWTTESETAWTTANFYEGNIGKDGKITKSALKESLTNYNAGDYTTAGVAGPSWKLDLGTLDTTSETTYAYYIELVAANNTVMGYASGTYTYEQIQGSLTDQMSETAPAVAIWHAGTYKATPEPTSAMLMLIGVAGLALRRKQRKA